MQKNNINELETFIATERVPLDIICITEHWLNSNESDFFQIKNYCVASISCRSELCHGGTLIAVKETLDYKPLFHLNNISVEKHCEIAAVKIENFNVVVNIYRSPNGDFNVFMEILEKLLNKIGINNKVIISGDFNVRFNTSDRFNTTLIDLLKTFGFEQTMFDNTRLTNLY